MKNRLNVLCAFTSITLVAIFVVTAEAFQTLDQFSVDDQTRWNCARTIAIKLFPVTGEFKGKKSLDYYQNDFANKLAAQLRKMPGIEKVDVVDGPSPITADVVIDGTFKDLTTGSRALRFWVGFGAGKAFCRADMRAVDPKSGTKVFSLDHARGSAMDIISDDELMENIDEVVEDVVAGLQAVRGVCPPAPSPENKQ